MLGAMDTLIVPRPTDRPTHRPTVLLLREPDRPYGVRRPELHHRPVRPCVAHRSAAPLPADGSPSAARWEGVASQTAGQPVPPRAPLPADQALSLGSEAALPTSTAPAPPPRLLDRLRSVLRARHYSLKTEAAYL